MKKTLLLFLLLVLVCFSACSMLDPFPIDYSESKEPNGKTEKSGESSMAAPSKPEPEQAGISDADYCTSKGFRVEVLPGGLIKLNGDSDELIAGTAAELDDKLGEAVGYSDVIDSINQNETIKEEYRKILIDGLNNLEKNGLNADLRILNYNIKRLVVQELPRSEIEEISGSENTVAFYRMKDGTVVIPNDSDPAVAEKKQISILHEILGHGMTETTLEDESIRISKLFIMDVTGEGDQRTIAPKLIAFSVSEGIADTITYYSLNGNYDVSYDAEVFQLEFLRNLLDLDLSCMIDDGATGIIKAMGEFGFEAPQIFVLNMDAETAARQADSKQYDGVTASRNIQMLVSEYVDLQRKRGVSAEEIEAHIRNVFEKSSFEEVVVDSILRLEVFSVSELKEQVLSSLNPDV